MHQTSYTGINAFTKGLQYDAGWCEFYYTPIENIDQWPTVLPLTQELSGEPVLKVGASWYGPIKVANQQLGYREQQQKVAAGTFYRVQLDGFYPGDGRASRVNLENMAHHQYVIVGKQRAGGMFLLVGAPDSGADFRHDYTSGRANTTALSEFVFAADLISKPMVLPSFGSQTSSPMPGAPAPPSGGGGSAETSNVSEVIEFINQPNITINYTDARKAKFGTMPSIEVWFKEGLTYRIANLPITVDAAPPNVTVFTIDFFGITDGFVVLK